MLLIGVVRHNLVYCCGVAKVLITSLDASVVCMCTSIVLLVMLLLVVVLWYVDLILLGRGSLLRCMRWLSVVRMVCFRGWLLWVVCILLLIAVLTILSVALVLVGLALLGLSLLGLDLLGLDVDLSLSILVL